VFFSKPSWQSGVTGVPNDGARDVPDVALTAAGHDLYLTCFHGSCSNSGSISFQGVYGTSAATPSFAGLMALVNQKTGSRQGVPNPTLYRLAAGESLVNCNASNTAGLPANNCIFNDVTVGTNAVPGEANYNTSSETYPAGVGYDLASGLGSVNAANLVNGWQGTSGGSPGAVFGVNPASGSGSSPTFTFTLTDAGGVSQYTQVHMLYNASLNGIGACHLLYAIGTNGLYLALDNVDQYSGPVTPGGSGTLSNSQCSIVASSVGVSITGTAITLTIPVNFTSSFAGNRNGYMMAFYNGSVATPWNQVGSWTVTQ
jgi:subtilase family serine protease